MLRHPCILRDLQTKGTKSEVAPLHLPSWGPTNGRKCYVTPPFSGIPERKGGKNRSGYLTPGFSGVQKRAEMLRHPCILGGPWLRGQNQKWLNWGQGQNVGCAVQKNTTKKHFRGNGVSMSKNTLKHPSQTIFKKGRGSKPPTLSDFSEPPPPLVGMSMGTGDGGVKVEERGVDTVQLGLGVEGHPQRNRVVTEEEEGGGVQSEGGG